MPTPAVHLFVSQQILKDESLASLDGRLRQQAGHLLLGSVAPDAWLFGLANRQQTHFLPVPMPADRQGARELLDACPELRSPADLAPALSAFVAGYMTHLLTDEIWYHQVYNPFFHLGAGANPPHRRPALLFALLRLHHESQLERELDGHLLTTLASVETAYDFPIVPKAVLERFRDQVVSDMQSDLQHRSAEVFAQRLGVPLDELLMPLSSPGQMEREVLGRLPAGLLDQVMQQCVAQAASLARDYLSYDQKPVFW